MAQRGCKLSIGDFGTGYSLLAYLKRLPVEELKNLGSDRVPQVRYRSYGRRRNTHTLDKIDFTYKYARNASNIAGILANLASNLEP